MLKNLGATGSGGSSSNSGAAKNLEAELDKVVKSAEKSADSVKKTMEKALGGSGIVKNYVGAIKQWGDAMAKLESTASGSKMETYLMSVMKNAENTMRKLEGMNNALRESKAAEDATADKPTPKPTGKPTGEAGSFDELAAQMKKQEEAS